MSKHHIGTVTNISPLLSDVFKVTVKLDHMPEINPGQFLNVKVPGFTLRRPFGISHFDYKAETISFCFQARGEGTKALSKTKVGDKLDLLLPLGNGFPVDKYKRVMIIGGGIGVFPLLPAAKGTHAILGFRNEDSVVLEKDFQRVATALTVVTDEIVTGVASRQFSKIQPDAIFACGPHAMFRALKGINFPCPVYISMEERMACGFGACICCTVDKQDGTKARVCCEGPVFLLSEVVL